jgi:hypothetical protein
MCAAGLAWWVLRPAGEPEPSVVVDASRRSERTERTLGDRGPSPAPATPPDAGVAPDETPTLERPQVQEGFPAHVSAVLPRWRAVTGLLAQSDQPDLQEVSGALVARMRAAREHPLNDADQRDLIAEERQLLNFLGQRYQGFTPLEDELRAIDTEVTAMDGG